MGDHDLMTETLVPLCDVAGRYPGRGGKPKHIGVIRRWVRSGVCGVKLEAVRIAGLWHTSEEALARFHRASAVARAERCSGGTLKYSPKARSEERRRRDNEAAKAFNRRHGVGV